MEEFVVLNNVENGMFLVPKSLSRWHDPRTNPRISESQEKDILEQFKEAKFLKYGNELELATVGKYLFRKYLEDTEDEIIWIDQNQN